MSVEVYSKNSCVQCNASFRALNKAGVEYDVLKIDGDDPSLLGYIQGLGFQQAPVVLLKDDSGEIVDSWSGFRPDKIDELAAA